MKQLVRSAALAAAIAFAVSAQAGPIIIDGTDANEHGSVSAGVNQAGWKYMQKAFENLGAAVTPTAAKVITVIGTKAGDGVAYTSVQSAFSLSSLVGAGWTINYVDGAANIAAKLGSLSTATTGLLYFSTYGLAAGDMDATEMAAVNAAAAQINAYVSGAGNAALGGALFAQGESGTGEFGWLETLIPGIISTDIGGGGSATDVTLTAAGNTAFPGLSNADLAGADPWHAYFSGNLGGLQILGTALQGGSTRAVIIGGGAGTVFQCGDPGQPPCPTPEPGSLPLVVGAGLAMLVAGARRRKPA